MRGSSRVPALGTKLDRYPHHRAIRKKPAADFLRLVYGLASIAANTIFSAAYFQGFGVLIIPIERTFGWDRWVISAAMSLRQLESGIVSPAVGLLLDRCQFAQIDFLERRHLRLRLHRPRLHHRHRRVFLFIVVISLGASGVSHAVTWPVIISRWFRRKRGLAMGLAVTGPIFGSPIVILNAQIEEAHGWRVVLIGYGIIILVGITLLSMLVRDRPEPYGLAPDGDPRRWTPPRNAPAHRSAGRTAGSRSMRWSAPGSSGCSRATCRVPSP